MSPDERWIVIPNWDDLQHYTDRDPTWIKLYTRLLHNPDYLGLTGHQRAVLHGLWLEYASSGRQVALNTASLSRQLGLRVSSAHLETLNQAGFIAFSASRPARARARSREEVLRTSKRAAGKNAAALPKNSEPPRDPNAAAKAREIAERLGQR